MSPLVSAAEVASLRADYERGFTTLATIKRPDFGSDELGDDAVDTDPATIGTVYGWLSGGPTAEPTNDGGIVTVNTHRFDTFVGTDIRPRDQLVIGGRSFTVTDTNTDETLPLSLSCTLRSRE
jgi:hypothetical protein